VQPPQYSFFEGPHAGRYFRITRCQRVHRKTAAEDLLCLSWVGSLETPFSMATAAATAPIACTIDLFERVLFTHADVPPMYHPRECSTGPRAERVPINVYL